MDQKSSDRNYWEDRYKNANTGWDIGYASTPISNYFETVENKDLKILIPGCGNAYEAADLHNRGFTNVFILDIAKQPLDNFCKKYPGFPSENVLHGDFFNHDAKYDIVVEQTFFCALPPARRSEYVKHMHRIIKPGGAIIALLFDKQFEGGPPFGGTRQEYESLFKTRFTIEKLEAAHNSIEPRRGSELFAIFRKEK